ncbi:acyl-CoA thioesterase [Halocalculus aciditolerans]|uniref:Acyl-CoA thioesterase n=1 Tax=Halocalculus aciditolerans TaxID=1383812 RepID=A0A830FJY7_9EURY|nr:acyl-CoA thioesterase [Halocalculus aciditolerans]GGL63953.1 acyl-CoA thioesterase [Halocalculus aciditolerans]
MATSDHDTTTLADSYTETTRILMPNHTNNLGRALGGTVLHWMDITGAIAARRFAREQVVTASMDHVDFRGPIDLGDVVAVTAYVFDTGDTSMDVLVTVHAERPAENERHEAAASLFTFVALDADEHPTSVPDLACPTDDQTALREEALDRRRALAAAP